MPRKATPAPAPTGTPAALMAEGGLLAHDFHGPSWDLWRAVLKAAWAEPMTEGEVASFREVAERDPPAQRVRELWAIVGRRGGKDSTAAAIAVSGALEDYTQHLRTGERATIACLATSRDQAAIIHRYVTGYFASIPILKSLVARETDDALELHNCVEIVISTNNFRAIRGRTIAVAILDEVAFFRDDGAASSDVDLYAALEPAMATIPTSILVGISSPYRRKGLLFNKWRQHYGKPDNDVLVVRGASRTFNSTLPQRIVDARMEVDPEAAASEYLAEWREGISDLFDRAL
ncbi:MAG TPA: hypothetical protein VHB27_04640, partial [Rhodopila sp.]|nr:hypothetical protein [Rhodopila sp.]